MVMGCWMLEAMDPPLVGLEVFLTLPFLFPVALLFPALQPSFPFNLKKVKWIHLLLLIMLANIAIWSFYIFWRGVAAGDAHRVANSR